MAGENQEHATLSGHLCIRHFLCCMPYLQSLLRDHDLNDSFFQVVRVQEMSRKVAASGSDNTKPRGP